MVGLFRDISLYADNFAHIRNARKLNNIFIINIIIKFLYIII